MALDFQNGMLLNIPRDKSKLSEDKICSMEYICPLFHERLDYFLVTDVFSKKELENDAYITKYNLSARYRDFKIIDKKNIPKGYPEDHIKFTNGVCQAISIRAMHRIACSELTTKSIHFMFDGYLRDRMIKDYDNAHGSIIKFMIHSKVVPVKYTMLYEAIIYEPDEHDPTKINVKTTLVKLPVIHIDSVWNLDNESGFLVYYLSDNIIKSFYMDSLNCRHFQIEMHNPTVDKLLERTVTYGTKQI